jgi:hypothetical protein
MDAVKMDRVRMGARVREVHADEVAFRAAQRRARHLTVVGPGRIVHAGRDLDFPVDRRHRVLPHGGAVGAAVRGSVVEMLEEHRGVEPAVADDALRGRARRIVGGVGDVRTELPFRGRQGAARRGEPGDAERAAPEQVPPAQGFVVLHDPSPPSATLQRNDFASS